MDDLIHTYFAQYELGQEADVFWQSELGKYALGCAKQDTDVALAKLKDVDPNDSKLIRELQNDVDRPARALGWLNDAIIKGREALHSLDELATPSE